MLCAVCSAEATTMTATTKDCVPWIRPCVRACVAFTMRGDRDQEAVVDQAAEAVDAEVDQEEEVVDQVA